MVMTAAEKQKAYRARQKLKSMASGNGLERKKVTNSNGNAPDKIVTRVTERDASVTPAEQGMVDMGFKAKVLGETPPGNSHADDNKRPVVKPTFKDLPKHIQQQIDKYEGNPLCSNRDEMVKRAIEQHCGASTAAHSN